MSDDTRPFPIQGEFKRGGCGPSTIPWWLAEIAYDFYVSKFGSRQSLELLAERGGFSRGELICFLRRRVPAIGSSWNDE